MRKEVLFKLLQRHTYTCLSHQYGIYIAFAGVVIVLYSMFQFGEELLEWSQTQYDSLFSLYHDNIAGQTFQAALGAPIPIDIVYTWVNGSDPVLLSQLNAFKQTLGSHEENKTKSDERQSLHCPHPDCFLLPCLVTRPSMGEQLTVIGVKDKFEDFSDIQWLKNLKVVKGFIADYRTNVTLLRFSNTEKMLESLKSMQKRDYNRTFIATFITTANYVQKSSPLESAIVLKGIPDKMTSDELKEKLPINIKSKTEWIYVAGGQHLALVWMNDDELVKKILDPKENSTVDFFGIGSEIIKILPARILATVSEPEVGDLAQSRFEDNEELRYSLRSVEQYAPWVRKIFIVTNGQIPYWMNLDNPRLTVVTHEEIFVNKSHLPTFSSPAIESHIHRIPGLAQKFIYMNDDVMFGREVWPDDFYTHRFGQKVYLTWPVPNCADGCSPSWIKDGFCDSACNVSQCSWDGGDCTGPNVRAGVGMAGGGYSYTPTKYCYAGCTDSWLADKFCDQSCNKIECGFDAGDCGLSNYDKFYKIKLKMVNGSKYDIPPGVKNAYIDISKHFRKVTKAQYDKDNQIRTAAVSNKFNVTTFVYKHDGNSSNIRVTLTGYPLHSKSVKSKGETGENKSTIEVSFNITAYPSLNVTVNMTELNKPDPEEVVIQEHKDVGIKKEDDFFNDVLSFPDDMKHPQIYREKTETSKVSVQIPDSFDESVLPENIKQKLEELNLQLKEEILTQSGFEKRRKKILLPFIDLIIKEKQAPTASKIETKFNKTKLQNNSMILEKFKDKIKQKEDLSETGHQHKKGDPGALEPLKNLEVIHIEQRKESKVPFKGNPLYRFIKEKRNSSNEDSKFKSRKLLSIDESEYVDRILLSQPKKSVGNAGFLPWEERGIFDSQVKAEEDNEKRRQVMKEFEIGKNGIGRRQLLDTFADSLRYVSNLYNKDFGFTQRKVPAHMPHFIDRDIMYELQSRYPNEYDLTSSHKLRHSQDMQFAFSYNYYVMSVKEPLNISKIFHTLDKDESGILSDREIRLLATRTHLLPLTLPELTNIEKNLKDCAWNLYFPKQDGKTVNSTGKDISELHQNVDGVELWALEEEYYDKQMPFVTEHLVLNCPSIVQLLNKSYSADNKYRHEVMPEDEVTFKMIRTNVSTVVGQLDDIRKNPKLFICLNDNIDHHKTKEAEMVKAVLRDFYETFFPRESQFELSPEYRNRFSDIHSLREWKEHRDYVTSWLRFALVILLLLTVLTTAWERYSINWRLPRNLILRKFYTWFFKPYNSSSRESPTTV